jgi:hypothetical protein
MANRKVEVNIDRLEIRLKGISAHTAQAAVKQLGSRLLKQLARDETFAKARPGPGIETLDAGTIKLQSGESKNPSGLRDRIVSGIVKSVGTKSIGSGGKK